MQPDGERAMSEWAMSRLARDERVTIVPWYERADFAEICRAPADDASERDYYRWHGRAMQAIGQLLQAGKAIEIVTVRPADYRAWLALHIGADSPASRQRFVRELAVGQPIRPGLS